MRKQLLSLVLIAGFAQAAPNNTNAGGDAPLIESPRATVRNSDFEIEISRIPERDRGEFLTNVKRVNAVLEQLYVTRVLAKEAEAAKLAQDPDVARKLQAAREKVLAQERMQAFEQSLKLPDFTQRVRELYLTDKARFTVEPTVKAAHILIGTKLHSDAEALEKAKEVKLMLDSHAKSFEQAAQELSEDPSAKTNHGDLGWFTANRMVKPFSDAAFAMKPGQISDPVKTPFGYHIIFVEDRKEGRQVPFDEAKKTLLEEVTRDYIQAAKAEYIDAIKSDKGIVVHQDEIIKLNPLHNLATDETKKATAK